MLIKHSASFSHLSLVTLAKIFFNGHALQLLLKAARMKMKSVLYCHTALGMLYWNIAWLSMKMHCRNMEKDDKSNQNNLITQILV